MLGKDLIKWIKDNNAENIRIFKEVDSQGTKRNIYPELKDLFYTGDDIGWKFDKYNDKVYYVMNNKIQQDGLDHTKMVIL